MISAEVAVTVVRHGSTGLTGRVINGSGVGAADPPLTSTGVEQILRTRAALVAAGHLSSGETQVRSSPALRALESAQLLIGGHSAAADLRSDRTEAGPCLAIGESEVVEPDARLAEVDFGSWEGLSPAEVFGSPRGAAWVSDPTASAPGGGSIRDCACAFDQVLAELLELGGRWLVVGHAGTVRVAAAAALGLPLNNATRIAVPPGGWIHARWWSDGGSSLETLASPLPSAASED